MNDLIEKMNGPGMREKWQPALSSARHIFTWTAPDELGYLCEVASRCSSLCELGSYMGMTAKVMTFANPILRLTCVDSWLMPGLTEVFTEHLSDEMVSGQVRMMKQTTADGLAKLALGGAVFDACFIDASHAYEDVKQDILGMLPLMRSGGLMTGHDYWLKDGPANGVSMAVKELLPGHTNPLDSIWAYLVP